MCECDFLSNIESVKGVFECVVVIRFVVIQCDDLWWLFVWYAVVWIGDRLVVGDRGEIYVDSFL